MNLQIQMPEKLKYPLFGNHGKKHVVIKGGRAGGKSESTAAYHIILSLTKVGNILCTRSIQESIRDSVYSLLKRKIHDMGLKNMFHITNESITAINTGSRFIFKGCQALSDAKKESGKGLDDVISCWFEEAHTAKEQEVDLIVPSIRHAGARFFWTYNSNRDPCYVGEYFSQHSKAMTVKINYYENGLCPQTLIDEAEEMRRIDPEKYMEIWEGEPRSDDDRAVLKIKWIDAAFAMWDELKDEYLGDAPRYGLDVSDGGGDSSALAEWRGSAVVNVEHLDAVDAEDTARKAAIEVDSGGHVFFDRVGVGSVVKVEMRKNYPHIATTAHSNSDAVMHKNKKWKGTKIKNKDMFANLGAQVWWELRERFRNVFKLYAGIGEISDDDDIVIINPKIRCKKDLTLQLKQIKYDVNTADKIVIQKKAKNEKSPDLADALMMGSRTPKKRVGVIS